MQIIDGLKISRHQVKQLYEELRLGASANYLMNREQVGIPLRRVFEERFASLPAEPTVVVVDFVGVLELTGSVAEEVGPMLFGTIETQRRISPSKYLIYDNVTREVRKELDAWFDKYKRCIPAFLPDLSESEANEPIIGARPPQNLLETLLSCYRYGPITSSELQEELRAAAKKLAVVQRDYPWLIHREKVRGDTPRSWRYLFIPLLPWDRIPSQKQKGLALMGEPLVTEVGNKDDHRTY